MEPNQQTNKQAKYNQRHWNKEQTVSYQRGGRRGIIGKGYQGTCIKDTWTKPKRVGSMAGGRDGWGKNGDICIWRII